MNSILKILFIAWNVENLKKKKKNEELNALLFVNISELVNLCAFEKKFVFVKWLECEKISVWLNCVDFEKKIEFVKSVEYEKILVLLKPIEFEK